ncbi:MAG: ATP-binding protein [Deltaproteobacteria bacterium]|nr:ATP-binding protein [Deltaproteobacteria bacterium]
MHWEFPVTGGNFSSAGEAAGKIKNILKKLGIAYEVIRRVSIASYEAEMNITSYADEGKLLLEIDPLEISITASDKGPGIPDIAKAMLEGFSTATPAIREMGFGAGMGLPNIQRVADWMVINSTVGKGTETKFKIFLNT